MRRAAKVDSNHGDVVAALRKQGASVVSLASVGKGCPDLLVGFAGVNLLMEIKRDDLPPSERRLNPVQQEWHSLWQGRVVVVESPEEAVAELGLAVGKAWAEKEAKP